MDITQVIEELKRDLRAQENHLILPQHESLVSFRGAKKTHLTKRIHTLLKLLEQQLSSEEKEHLGEVIASGSAERLRHYLITLTVPSKEPVAFNPRTFIFPEDVHGEIRADCEELERCFRAKCYRSVVILCGRILETALHRKYFEVTNNDLLEKAPGIGLGTVVAKLAEKGIIPDPALANQIHIINQVRIHSVHKKQQPFTPSEQQTRAIMLYTADVVQRLFT